MDLAYLARLAHPNDEAAARHEFVERLPPSLNTLRLFGVLNGKTLRECTLIATDTMRGLMGKATAPAYSAPAVVDDPMLIGAMAQHPAGAMRVSAEQRKAWFDANLCSKCGKAPGPKTAECPNHWAGPAGFPKQR